MADVNWEKIKSEYITTDTSQRKLAKKYSVSMNALTRRCKKEEWVKQRERYKSKVVAKTVEKSANREANRLARLMDTTSKAIDVAVKAFGDQEQFNRYIVERREKYAFPTTGEDEEDPNLIAEKTWSEEQVYAKIDTKALKDMTAVLKDLTALMRDFYNMPTPAQAEAQRIAAERLELDKRKAENDEVTDTEVIVHFTGDIEEFSK
jgi:hypothetical protein